MFELALSKVIFPVEKIKIAPTFKADDNTFIENYKTIFELPCFLNARGDNV